MLRATLFALFLGFFALGGGRASASEVPVEIGDFYFCSASQAVGTCETVVNAGDTVRWTYNVGTEGHTVTHCGDSCATPTSAPLFDSGALNTGQSFAFTFDTPGRYLYYCAFHPPFMQAALVVQPAQATATPAPTAEPTTPAPALTEEPAPTPAATPTTRASRAPTPSPTATPLAQVAEQDDGGNATVLLVVAGVVVVAAAATAAVYAIWRRRARGHGA